MHRLSQQIHDPQAASRPASLTIALLQRIVVPMVVYLTYGLDILPRRQMRRVETRLGHGTSDLRGSRG